MSRLHIDYLTLFPDAFGYLQTSILKRAQAAGVLTTALHDMRDQATNRHRTVDDKPFGGGVGMVLKPDIVWKSLQSANLPSHARIIVTTPQGRTFDQAYAKELAKESHLVFLCGHYEGIDERVHQHMVTDELSIGDYVLTGGELPALVVTDAVVRLLPGVLGKQASPHEDSFWDGLLDYPHYTRPADFMGHGVPEVLLSGDHARVARWRREQALQRTFERRPDLLAGADLTKTDQRFLAQLAAERERLVAADASAEPGRGLADSED
ncbi:MAG: tRNA (guanosine(37)-N1)-methyltransferase TrmD [Candidatus Sericytochromatia bacterium]|nr:tRNA (guanosine(37)-N1)-methyltransferase TrmD [Candidatus Sericytochromatia bacterium]